ncbi:MAG: DUF488 domain-containing protein [Fimbriimonadaceae bacterium]|nr:DUF488 domain-containing protein [Fimbriimonadaceae bacterium]
MPILSIGYGGRSEGEFWNLLRSFDAAHLVDVRSRPFGMFPDFNRPTLEVKSREWGIPYKFMGDELGGKPDCPNCYDDDGQVSYPLVREQDFYQRGIERLVELQLNTTACLMCAERRPGDCHRSLLIGIDLLQLGIEVLHVLEVGQVVGQRALMRVEQPSLL